MQKVITIAHQKGGVGKSTLALNLAVELSKRYPLKVVDLDFQKSITIFNENRMEAGLEPLDVVNVEDQKELMRLIDNSGELVLIDSGGFDSDLNRIALLGADLVITPLSNNLIEVYGLESFKKILKDLKEVRSDIRSKVLLNNVHPKTQRAIDELREFIAASSEYFDLFETVIRRRSAFAKSFEEGKSVVEMDDRSPASKELNQLVQEIESIVISNER